ncbi:TIGR01777 family oxidoreductase [Desulforhopalus sp. 52FAK]
MKTMITGCTGLVGSALIEGLFNNGHSLQCLKRDLTPDSNHFWATDSLPKDDTNTFEAVIHLAGENVANGRWSQKKKESILSSRLDGTREIIDYISLLTEKPKVFLCASAIGFYGSRGNELLDENSSLGVGFLAEVCQQWEKETQRLEQLGVRVVNLRFGMILSAKGGALSKMIPPFKAGLGGVVGTGEQHISWISIRDVVSIIDFIMNNEAINGPVNVVSPIQCTNREFTKTLGEVLSRPTIFKVPTAVARLIFGQMADEMLLTSCRVTPQKLMHAGYTFLDQSLESVLNNCVESR